MRVRFILSVANILALALVACGGGESAAGPTPTLAEICATPTPTATSNASVEVTFTEATCVRVIDGDTIEVLIEGETYKVRYIGIDAPELDDDRSEYRALAEQAAQANKDMVEGKDVSLGKDVSETDRYGRLLRYVYVGYICINAELVADGYAWAISYPPDTKYDSFLQDLAAQAEQQGLGVWSLP